MTENVFFTRLNGMLRRIGQFFTVRRILLSCYVFALLWLVLFWGFNQDIYRDVAGCYAWYAREFGRGIWCGIPIAALPPLNIFLGGLMAKCGIEAYRALILLSMLCFILTIFPLYRLLRFFLPEKQAAWGCFLFVMTPKVIRFAGMGLLEATRDLFLVSAFYCFFQCRNAKWRYAAGLGFSLGLLALSRGEGIVMAGLLFLGLFLRPIKEYRDLSAICRSVLLPAFITALTALAIISPRLIETWKLTGYPVTDSRCIGVFQSLPGANRFFQDRRLKTCAQIDPAWDKTEAEKPSFSTRHPLLAAKLELPGQIARGGYEIYMVLAALGIGMLFLHREWRKEHSFLLFFSLTSSIIISCYSQAYRYFIFLVPLLMPFTIGGLVALLGWADRIRLRPVLLVTAAAVVLIQPVNAWGALFRQHSAHREQAMAHFIRENRQRFLPQGETERKLIVHCVMRPEIAYWTDESRVYEYSENESSPTLMKNFDLLLIESKDLDHVKLLEKRRDLRIVHHPFEQDYTLFAIVREGKDERQ